MSDPNRKRALRIVELRSMSVTRPVLADGDLSGAKQTPIVAVAGPHDINDLAIQQWVIDDD